MSNPYEILGIPKNSSIEEIKKAYKTLVKKFHPDKISDNNKKKERKFEIITEAYNLLKDEESRKQFDEISEIIDSTKKGHKDLRDEYHEYLKASEYNNILTEDEKDELVKKLKEEWKVDENILTKEELKKKIDDMEMIRNIQDVECVPENLFEGKKFDVDKFNALFESKNWGNNDIIKMDFPNPINSGNIENTMFFDVYNSAPFGENETFINMPTKKDFKNININKKEENPLTNETMEELMERRRKETEELNNLSLSDFNNNKTPYSFSHQIAGILSTYDWNEASNNNSKIKLLN